MLSCITILHFGIGFDEKIEVVEQPAYVGIFFYSRHQVFMTHLNKLLISMFAVLFVLPLASTASAQSLNYTLPAGSGNAIDISTEFDADAEFYLQDSVMMMTVENTIAGYAESGTDYFGTINALEADTEIYPFVLDRDGLVLAHGANPDNANTLHAQDVFGKETWQEALVNMDKYGSSWTTYTFLNPTTNQEEPKLSFFVLYDNYIFGSGLYSEHAIMYNPASFITLSKNGTLNIDAVDEAPGIHTFLISANNDNEVVTKTVIVQITDAMMENTVMEDVMQDDAMLDYDMVKESKIDLTHAPPLKQLAGDAKPLEVVCNEPSQLYIRDSDIPICVTAEMYNLLTERGIDVEPVSEREALISKAAAQVRQTIAQAMAKYDANDGGQSGLDALTRNSTDIFYPFVLDNESNVIAHGSDPRALGPVDIKAIQPSKTPEEVRDIIAGGATEIWLEYRFNNPATGEIGHKRTLLIQYDDYLFGSGYYTLNAVPTN